MTLKIYVKLCCIIFLSSIILLAGCASTVPVKPEERTESQLLFAPDKSLPTTPMAVVVAQGGPTEKIVAEPMLGSVASVLKKMEMNPLSLYWREKHAYTYFASELLDAEYRLNEGSLRVRDVAGKSTVLCVYDVNGTLQKTEGIDTRSVNVKEVCSKLMLSLDDDMSS